jgi:putative lipoic acid-binding regulatory protein
MAEPESLIQYPSAFPIKVVGVNEPGFEQAIAQILKTHAPDFDVTSIQVRESRAAKYLSISATITARSRGQLDALYMELTGHPMVRVVL